MTKKQNEIELRLDLVDKIVKLNNLAGKDLFYFTKNIIGFNDLSIKTHRPLCKFLTDSKLKNKKLVLLPRGSFKTSICTISYPIYKLLNFNPNLRFLISSDTYDNAKKCLFKIKNILEENQKVKLLYGDQVGQRWREDEIDIKSRVIKQKEPSISCGSQDVTRVGQHYDVIILDDIITDVNTQTKEQMIKTIEYFKSLFSILEPNGEMIIVGTRWTYNSNELYQYIIENLSNEFEIMVRSAINEKGELFFEERLGKEVLETFKKLQGSYMFSAQYMNNPVSPEDKLFRNIKEYQSFNEIPKDLYITITIDPAISLDTKGDYTGIIVCGTDSRECIYVLEALNLKVSATDLIDTIFYLNDKWKPNAIGLEVVAYQKSLKYFLESDELKRGKFLPLVELKTDTRKSKFLRIQALQPYFERGQIIIKEDMKELKEQLETFPKSSHDDLLDALSYQLQIISKPIQEIVELKDPMEDYIDKKMSGYAVLNPRIEEEFDI